MRKLSVFLLLLFFANISSSYAYILCKRETQISPVTADPTTEEDPCTGEVLLQGMEYECVPLDEVDEKRKEFLHNIKKEGHDFCNDYCKERSTRKIKCEAFFKEPMECGFTVPTKYAAEFGKEGAPCSPSCKGTSFAYCSIYHASYIQINPQFFKGMQPNCRCRRAE